MRINQSNKYNMFKTVLALLKANTARTAVVKALCTLGALALTGGFYFAE